MERRAANPQVDARLVTLLHELVGIPRPRLVAVVEMLGPGNRARLDALADEILNEGDSVVRPVACTGNPQPVDPRDP